MSGYGSGWKPEGRACPPRPRRPGAQFAAPTAVIRSASRSDSEFRRVVRRRVSSSSDVWQISVAIPVLTRFLQSGHIAHSQKTT